MGVTFQIAELGGELEDVQLELESIALAAVDVVEWLETQGQVQEAPVVQALINLLGDFGWLPEDDTDITEGGTECE